MVRDISDVGHDHSFAVRWQNFRAFEDTGWVALKPLTMLLGPNSAGKSSFIAPLLLLKQSLHSRTGTNALLTRGEHLDVGIYDDFVRNHKTLTEVEMGIRWHSHPRKEAVAPPGGYPPGGLVVAFEQGQDEQSVRLRSYLVEDTYRRALLRRARQQDGKYSTRMAAPPKNAQRTKRGNKTDAASRRAMRNAIRDARPDDFLFRSKDIRLAGIQARIPSHQPGFSGAIDDDRTRFYCSITDYAEWNARSLLESLHYIGPLREAPRRVYELSGEMPDSVGTRGEFAPEIVYRWRNDKKRMREVQRWLRHFGFRETLDFKAVGTGGFSLMLSRDGAPVASAFVDTGFGMSQVLPLIVQSLLADAGDWLVVEQPEIHLNPRLQAALADLFVSVVNRDIGLVIESHSEHLLLRLRRLVAQRKLQEDDFGLYFVEQDEGKSDIRQVSVERGGFIAAKEWPRGFFEDALKEAMSLAQEQAHDKRRRLREERSAASSESE